MSHVTQYLLLSLLALFAGTFSLRAETIRSFTIDAFPYATVADANAAWRAMDRSPSARHAQPGALTFPVPFDEDRDRVYWDTTVRLDLSAHDIVRLDLTCPHPEALRSLALYFKSGNGWYIWNRPLRTAGRQTLQLMKSDFDVEGKPAGWNKIEVIRISPWKGAAIRTTLTLHRLSAHHPSILLVRGTGLPPGEQQVAQRTTQRISQWLSDANLTHSILEDSEVSASRLARSTVVILGYSPSVSPVLRARLRTFTERGGRVIVFYSGDEELAQQMGFRLGEYASAGGRGQWSSMRFVDPSALRVPQRIYQESWNIRPAHPASPTARVIAWWENAEGRDTGHPAWVLSDKGAWMSHILLTGDDDHKRALLTSLIAHFDPSQWPELARHAVQQAGAVGPYATVTDAMPGIRKAAARGAARAAVDQALRVAEEQTRRMERLFTEGRYPEAMDMARALRRSLVQAYALAQQPRPNELRGVWDHAGTGLYPGDWDRTARLLAENGINTLFVNVMWGGVAHYASDVLPRSATFRLYGDQLEQAIRAGRKHGLKVHVWKVCWNLTGSPPEFVAAMRKEGRTIRTADGEDMPWLNPAHPDNQRLLLASLKEVAERYAPDGIHLDYIRYPHRRTCFSDFSRRRFENTTGRRATRWPDDALPGGPLDEAFRRFRVDQINHGVREMHRHIRRDHPDLILSAAVWGGYPDVIQSIGQDWMPWLQRGELDFVVPMNYTANQGRFMHLTRSQLHYAGARGKIYPGLGVTSSESQLSADQVIQQILGLRELGAPGWVLFDLNHTLRNDILPMLRLGITADP